MRAPGLRSYVGEVIRYGAPWLANTALRILSALGLGLLTVVSLLLKVDPFLVALAAVLPLVLLALLGGYLAWKHATTGRATAEQERDALRSRVDSAERPNTDFHILAGVPAAYRNRNPALPAVTRAIRSARERVILLSWDFAGVYEGAAWQSALQEAREAGVSLDIYFYEPTEAQLRERAIGDRKLRLTPQQAVDYVQERVARAQPGAHSVITRLPGEGRVTFGRWPGVPPVRDVYAVDPDDDHFGVIFVWSYYDQDLERAACVELRPTPGAPGSLYYLVREYLRAVEQTRHPYSP
jgi:hypothetical protein